MCIILHVNQGLSSSSTLLKLILKLLLLSAWIVVVVQLDDDGFTGINAAKRENTGFDTKLMNPICP